MHLGNFVSHNMKISFPHFQIKKSGCWHYSFQTTKLGRWRVYMCSKSTSFIIFIWW